MRDRQEDIHNDELCGQGGGVVRVCDFEVQECRRDEER